MNELRKQLEKEREELFQAELEVRKSEHEYGMISQRIRLIKREIRRKERLERIEQKMNRRNSKNGND